VSDAEQKRRRLKDKMGREGNEPPRGKEKRF